MRKLIMMNRVTVDGLFAGPRGENHEWFVDDADATKATYEMMNPDTLLLGRVTYQLFEGVWPKVLADPKAPPLMKKAAQDLDQMNKVVFSTTLDKVSWNNSRLVKTDPVAEVRRMKDGRGADITIFGSGTIVQQLTTAGLIDEHIIVLTPVVLGKGKPMFKEVKQARLELLECRRFETGNVVLHYKCC